MSLTFHLDIVYAEGQIFSGPVEKLIATGVLGELCILAGHTPLLTMLKPGHITFNKSGEDEEIFYVSGGMLEVQPKVVTILADTILRAEYLDEAVAEKAREDAKKLLNDRKSNFDYGNLLAQLSRATAQLNVLNIINRKNKK